MRASKRILPCRVAAVMNKIDAHIILLTTSAHVVVGEPLLVLGCLGLLMCTVTDVLAVPILYISFGKFFFPLFSVWDSCNHLQIAGSIHTNSNSHPLSLPCPCCHPTLAGAHTASGPSCPADAPPLPEPPRLPAAAIAPGRPRLPALERRRPPPPEKKKRMEKKIRLKWVLTG